MENDEELYKLRNALLNGDTKTIKTSVKNVVISDNWADQKTTFKTKSQVNPEDLSLYKNCVLVRDRISAPEDLKRNFFNNLHLGHRSVDIM